MSQITPKIFLNVLAFFIAAGSFGQEITLDLTFTARKNMFYVQLDSVKVMNRTTGGDTVIYWPDTTLTLKINSGDLLLNIGYSTVFPQAIIDNTNKSAHFELYQNYPNPVRDHCIISMFIPEKGNVCLGVTDIQGRSFMLSKLALDKGVHSFRFTPGAGNLCFFTAQWQGVRRSIKVVTPEPHSGMKFGLEYIGNTSKMPLKELAFTSYPVMVESGILDSPVINKTYTFEFSTNIPCPETPVVTYEGTVYNTIQIFSQCWFKENLNVGKMIPGVLFPKDDGIIEKYCSGNNLDTCEKYGGLYKWDEMMKYNAQQNLQGICPPGWHIPTDEEWKVLEGAADTHYRIGDHEWDVSYYDRGHDGATNLKAKNAWTWQDTGIDLLGFTALPGGRKIFYGTGFVDLGYMGSWWTSTRLYYPNDIWYRHMVSDRPYIQRNTYPNDCYSVRCLRDF